MLLFLIYANRDFWIGMVDMDNSGIMRWVHSCVPTWVKWGLNATDYIGGQCVYMKMSTPDPYWAISDCSESRKYICQQSLGK